MAEELKVGCSRPTGGPVGEKPKEESTVTENIKKESNTMISVGQKAPDFAAPAYKNGSFINVQLSDFLGKWVVLCFYPGDFTFV